MYRFLRHRPYVGALMLVTALLLAGCTDIMVGPEQGATNQRVLAEPEAIPLQDLAPPSGLDDSGVPGRVNHRSPLSLPPPDTSRTGPSPSPYPYPPPSTRLGGRFQPQPQDSLGTTPKASATEDS